MQYALKLATDEPLADVEDRLRKTLKEEGFGILTEIDVQATLKEKLGLDVPAHRILGACNPPLAHQVLAQEPDVGVLLPCNVTLYEQDGRTIVSAMKPTAALTLVDNPEVGKIAQEVEGRIINAMRAAVPGADIEGL